MTGTRPAIGSGKRGGRLKYGWHFLLAAVIAAECLVAWIRHDTTEELRALRESGSPREKVRALFVLTNRDQPEVPDGQAIARSLRSDDPLVREWMMTPNFARHAPRDIYARYLASLSESAEALRCRFLLMHGIGQGRAMGLTDLRQFLAATRDDR
jgi:hypothetical protein